MTPTKYNVLPELLSFQHQGSCSHAAFCSSTASTLLDTSPHLRTETSGHHCRGPLVTQIQDFALCDLLKRRTKPEPRGSGFRQRSAAERQLSWYCPPRKVRKKRTHLFEDVENSTHHAPCRGASHQWLQSPSNTNHIIWQKMQDPSKNPELSKTRGSPIS